MFHKRREGKVCEWGIFMSQGTGLRDLRAYIPHRGGIYSMMKFVPSDNPPPSWNLKLRIRPPDPKVKPEPFALKPEPVTKLEPVTLTPAVPPIAAPPAPNLIPDQEGVPLVPPQHPVITHTYSRYRLRRVRSSRRVSGHRRVPRLRRVPRTIQKHLHARLHIGLLRHHVNMQQIQL